jgi:hypothetical protein
MIVHGGWATGSSGPPAILSDLSGEVRLKTFYIENSVFAGFIYVFFVLFRISSLPRFGN